MKNNHRLKIILLNIFLLCLTLIFATAVHSEPADDTEDESGFSFTIGTKGYYSSGVAEDNFYYKPFGELEYTHPFFTAMAGGYRYQNYQITDGYGNYSTINFNQGGGELTLTPVKWLEFGGSYLYAGGDKSYKSGEYSGALTLYFSPFTISGDYTRKKTSYTFDLTEVKRTDYDYSGTLEYEISDTVSVEGEYTFLNNHFDTLDYDYNQKIGRLGAILTFSESFNLMFGASAGVDSSKYSIYGGDASLTARFFGGLKLTLLYNYYYYAPPSQGSSGTGGRKGGTVTTTDGSTQTNPFLKTSLVGESYSSHTLGAGISYTF